MKITADCWVQAGVNLNVVGALAGAFSGKSNKETKEDGSSDEHREGKTSVRGAGAANMGANGAASAQTEGREMRQTISAKDH